VCKTEKKTQNEFHDRNPSKDAQKGDFPATRQAILGGLQKASGGADVQNKAAAKGLVYSNPKRKVEKSYLCLEEWFMMDYYSLYWGLRYCRSGKLQVFVAGIQTYLWTCGRCGYSLQDKATKT
jgi:ribosomal protein S27AE